MKKFNSHLTIFFAFILFSISTSAQQGLAANQNPGYEESRAKYMSVADSMNSWHSTTSQETYTAIDYMADLRAERARRREFRRQVHLGRVRRYGWYNNDYGYYPTNGDGYYNNYDYNSSYYGRYYRNNPFWLPVTLGLNFHIK